MSLSGQRVLVVGGTTGIGFAVAEAAAGQGASVMVASRNQENIDKAVSRLPAGAEGGQVDVTDERSVQDFFARAGEFDHLAYTAGQTLRMRQLGDLTIADAQAAFDALFWGAFTVAKYAAASIRGSLTFTSGVIAVRPAVATVAQASVAGAVESLVRALAVELAPLRVNGVRLGPVPNHENPHIPNQEALYKLLSQQLLTGRLGTPPEAAEAYLYLMRGTFTTGVVLPADGGYVLVANPRPAQALRPEAS